MTQKSALVFGTLICIFLAWNIWTIQALESRIARLETGQTFIGDKVSAKSAKEQDIKTSSDRSHTREQNIAVKASKSRSERFENSDRSKISSNDPSDIKNTIGSAVLGLDDPKVKEVFDEYLDQYLKTWQDKQKSNAMSNFLDHMSTATEVFCEESGLTEEVREQIIQKLENAHEVWIANDVALETGEIDRREYQEIDETVSKEVKKDMTELIGKEAWEKLSQRIWGY